MGRDNLKDQSYFLFTLTQQQLSMTLFPLGEMTKSDVRALASHYRLKVAEKSESQEICFIPDNDYVRFLEQERGAGLRSGNIVDVSGKILGHHEGTYRFTVGQRRGLGIAFSEPLYVVGINPERLEVIAGTRPHLASSGLSATNVNWIIPCSSSRFDATCKIRYRHRPVPCTVEPQGDSNVLVHFHDTEAGVTPGQAVVLYDGDIVLGGGWIERSFPATGLSNDGFGQ
jgi:tRNA-specific 2-thiouridylase